jgi:phosphoglycolate phosphatase
VTAARTAPRAANRRAREPTPIRAILFDKDGTLFDFRKSWLAAYRGAAAELAEVAGLDRSFVDILLARHGYDPASDTFAAESPLLWAATRDQAALWSAEPELAGIGDVARRLERHFSDLDAYPPVPVTDLVALFERLRGRGVKLGIASMDGTAVTEATLVRLAARELVDFCTGCDGGHGIKPGPGMVLGFCAAVGVPPRAVAVVGDNLADLTMARAAGAGLAIAVLTGGCPAEALEAEADLVLPSIAELEAALCEERPSALDVSAAPPRADPSRDG